MKDYYYFLGIKENCSVGDIKQVYRRLSLKYHPDKNPNEEAYFQERFLQLQEAYDTLIDAERRQFYDQNLARWKSSNIGNLPPVIKEFTVNKWHASKGEEIIVKWHTQNADVVKILPFGLEKPYGERIFKINEFTNGKFQLLLHITNSTMRKTVVQGINISQSNHHSSTIKASDSTNQNPKNEIHQREENKRLNAILRVIIVVVLLFAVALLLI